MIRPVHVLNLGVALCLAMGCSSVAKRLTDPSYTGPFRSQYNHSSAGFESLKTVSRVAIVPTALPEGGLGTPNPRRPPRFRRGWLPNSDKMARLRRCFTRRPKDAGCKAPWNCGRPRPSRANCCKMFSGRLRRMRSSSPACRPTSLTHLCGSGSNSPSSESTMGWCFGSSMTGSMPGKPPP